MALLQVGCSFRGFRGLLLAPGGPRIIVPLPTHPLRLLMRSTAAAREGPRLYGSKASLGGSSNSSSLSSTGDYVARAKARLRKSIDSQRRFESVLLRAERRGVVNNATLDLTDGGGDSGSVAAEPRRSAHSGNDGASAAANVHGKKAKTASSDPLSSSNRRHIAPVASPDMRRVGQSTGAFHALLPEAFPGPTHFRRALRSLAAEVRPDELELNVRARYRKHAAKSLDALMKALNAPLTEALTAYGVTLRNLHPYEATVANLTVISRCKQGLPHLNDILGRVRALRAATSSTAKAHAAAAARAVSVHAAIEGLEAGREALQALYAEGAAISSCLTDLVALQRALRRVPNVSTDVPTCVLVGCPNVGKSSIVRVVSSGTPEVNNYPFTTRGVTVGHIADPNSDEKLQVMDTPGLLDRPEAERNEMEQLTYASMAHLPTAVVFVIDPTGMAGDDKSSLAAQLAIREQLRRRFPHRPWLDVVTKMDLPVRREALSMLPESALRVSTCSGLNVPELRRRLRDLLLEDLPRRLRQRHQKEEEEEEEQL